MKRQKGPKRSQEIAQIADVCFGALERARGFSLMFFWHSYVFGTRMFLALVCFSHLYVFHTCMFLRVCFFALVCFFASYVFFVYFFRASKFFRVSVLLRARMFSRALVCFFLDAHTSDFTIYACLKISL